MQFTLALFGLSAMSTLAAAAPVLDIGQTLTAPSYGGGNPDKPGHNDPGHVVCPKGKKHGCSTPPAGGKPPKDTDNYGDCVGAGQIGLVNLFICNILNDIDISVPITITAPIASGNDI